MSKTNPNGVIAYVRTERTKGDHRAAGMYQAIDGGVVAVPSRFNVTDAERYGLRVVNGEVVPR